MLKKLVIAMVVGMSIILTSVVPAMASENDYDYFKMIELVIGEKQAEVNFNPSTMDQAAYVKGGRTLVPFRFLGESLGAEISWDSKLNQAKLKLGQTEVIVTLGSKVAYINGKMSQLDVPAESKGGRVFVPLRFVSESLGAYVDFSKETQTITVKYVDTSNWKEYSSPSNEVECKYPANWDVSTESDNYVVCFTSPKGSKLWLYYVSDSPDEVRTSLKKNAEENGWVFNGEELDDPSDPNQGYQLNFYKTDPDSGEISDYFVYTEPADGGTYISEMLINDNDVDIDGTVMLEITYD